MRILLAGATGVLGRALIPMLIEAGHEVIGFARKVQDARDPSLAGARLFALDAFDREAVRQNTLAVRPDVIMHQLTALSEGDRTANARLRGEGTRNLVDAAKAAGVRRMIAQSLAMAYAPGVGPARETDPLDLEAEPPRRTTIDGVRALEDAVAELEEAVVLRYGALYGPGTWYASDGAIGLQVQRGELLTHPGITSFIHVQDAARAAVSALAWPRGPVNIVDDEPAAATAWLPVFARAIGAPAPLAGGHGQPYERGASNEKARRQYGFTLLFPSWRASGERSAPVTCSSCAARGGNHQRSRDRA